MSREMKQSGVPWLKDIPSEWKVERGKNVLVLLKRPVRDDDEVVTCFRDGEVILRSLRRTEGFTMSDKEIGYQGINEGDIVIHGMDGFAGAMGVSKSTGKGSPVLVVCSPKYDAIPQYIIYYLRALAMTDVFIALATGIRERSCDLRWNKISELEFILPSSIEQQKIASFLDRKCAEIDEMITLQEKIVEELKAYRQSKVKELFDTYMATETFTILKLGAMASLVTKQTGFDYSNTISHALVGELSENTIPYLQTKHFKDGYWNYNTDYYIPKDVAVRFPKILLNKKSLLFSIVGASIGNVAVFPATTTAFLGGAICKVDLIKERDYEYIKHFMMSIYGQEQISSKINSSAQGTITVQNVRDFKIPMFDNPNVQNAITEEVSLLGDRISSLIAIKLSKIDSLKEYKKSIIYEYVTGKKEVTE